jgi:SAM-dependent methyltransferase
MSSNGVRYYADLFGSAERIRGMRRGIREAVRPGDRVLEIGTGLGTFAFFAVEAGAAEVIAVDRDPIIHVAESAAIVNGSADRVRFLRGEFPDAVDVEGPFDVVIFEDLAGLVLDAERSRILEAAVRVAGLDARFVPPRVRCALVPVQSAELAARLVPELAHAAEFGIEPSLLRPLLANECFRTIVAAEHHVGTVKLGEPVRVFPPPGSAGLAVAGEWRVDRDVIVHALVAWFDLEVAAGVWVSNGPEGEPQPWAQYAFPLEEPLPVPAGTAISAEAGPSRLEDGAPGTWRWRVSGVEGTRSGDEMLGRPFGRPDLERNAPSGTASGTPR